MNEANPTGIISDHYKAIGAVKGTTATMLGILIERSKRGEWTSYERANKLGIADPSRCMCRIRKTGRVIVLSRSTGTHREMEYAI